MIEFLNKAIALNNYNAMIVLGIYYINGDKVDIGMELLLKAVEQGYPKAMQIIGQYYYQECFNIHNQYKYKDLAKKYLLMGVEYNNFESIKSLFDYYRFIENDINKIIKYYCLGIFKGIMLEKYNCYKFEDIFPEMNKLYVIDNYTPQKFIDYINSLIKKNKHIIIEKLNIYKCKNVMLSKIYNEYIMGNIKMHNSDFSIITDENEYFIHSLVLNSPFFENYCFIDHECNKNNITIKNDKVAKELIKFLYTGEIDIKLNKNVYKELYDVSKFYCFDDLTESCDLLFKYSKIINEL